MPGGQALLLDQHPTRMPWACEPAKPEILAFVRIGEHSMAQPTRDQPTSDFPDGLARPALRALSAAGYTQLAQLSKVTEAQLLALHGMGPKALGLLRGALQARGLAFADADKA